MESTPPSRQNKIEARAKEIIVEFKNEESVEFYDNSQDFVIETIKSRLKKITEFSSICQREADDSSDRKRRNRIISIGVGGLTAVLGFIGTIFSEQPIVGKVVGPLTTATGSIIAVIGEYIDPKKSRESAIEKRKLSLKLDNLVEEKKIEFLRLKDNSINFADLHTLNTSLREEFTTIQAEAFDNGINI